MENDKQQLLTCSGDCMNCRQVQWQYCASQFTLNTLRMVERLQGVVGTISENVAELKQKVENIENGHTEVFKPSDVSKKEDVSDGVSNSNRVFG